MASGSMAGSIVNAARAQRISGPPRGRAANHSLDLCSRPTASIRMILKMTIAAPFLGVVGLLASQRMLVRSGDAITVSTRNVLRQNKTVAVQVFLATNLRSNEDLEQISMINTFESAEGLAVTAAARSGRFDPTSIVLHWLTVLLIIGQFTTAWLHEAVGHETIPALEILPTHRTMGVLTWTVGLARASSGGRGSPICNNGSRRPMNTAFMSCS